MKKNLMWLSALIMSAWVVGAGAADVPLGPGDVLKISVHGHPDLSLETRVSEAGSITFPLVGVVSVGGQDTFAAEKKIAGLLESGGFIRKSHVNIIVTQMQSRQVSVLGQVNRPGRHPIDGKRTLTDILALAGGASAEGGDTVILIRTRDGEASREVIDILEMVRSGDMTKNRELASNDIIYVERAPRFYIYGEVQRPGVFRLERNMTVLQALSVGGGLTLRGTERGVRIKRRDTDGNMQVLEARHDELVRVDDVIYIRESLF